VSVPVPVSVSEGATATVVATAVVATFLTAYAVATLGRTAKGVLSQQVCRSKLRLQQFGVEHWLQRRWHQPLEQE
jgi:hypothetical protein